VRIPACLLLALAASPVATSQVVFESSDLPVFVVDTDGEEIPDEPRVDAHLGVIDNGPGRRNALGDPFNGYDGLVGIEIRGSFSQTFPKNGFALETRNPDRSNNNVSLLGMPEENDWVLHGPYSDKALFRNALAYDLARATGRYASRARFFELVLNGDYRGVYLLLEKIKRDGDRVDVATLHPHETDGDDLTGGYLFAIDKPLGGGGGCGADCWESAYASNGYPIEYRYHDPNAEELVDVQKAYIQNFMADVEEVLMGENVGDPETGYASVLDVDSFVDYFLVNELTYNYDAYRRSAYFYKDKDSNDPRLVAGPVWDFNIALGNPAPVRQDFRAFYVSTDRHQVPQWWPRLLRDPSFAAAAWTRWSELRAGPYHPDALDARITHFAEVLGEAQARNFERWPVLGTYVPINSFIGETHEEEVAFIRAFVHERADWLDDQVRALAVPDGPPSTSDSRVGAYPNPAAGPVRLVVEVAEAQPVRVGVYDLLGRRVGVLHDGWLGGGQRSFLWESGASGVYVAVVEGAEGWRETRRFVVTN
jgi:hypothetical protein